MEKTDELPHLRKQNPANLQALSRRGRRRGPSTARGKPSWRPGFPAPWSSSPVAPAPRTKATTPERPPWTGAPIHRDASAASGPTSLRPQDLLPPGSRSAGRSSSPSRGLPGPELPSPRVSAACLSIRSLAMSLRSIVPCRDLRCGRFWKLEKAGQRRGSLPKPQSPADTLMSALREPRAGLPAPERRGQNPLSAVTECVVISAAAGGNQYEAAALCLWDLSEWGLRRPAAGVAGGPQTPGSLLDAEHPPLLPQALLPAAPACTSSSD